MQASTRSAQAAADIEQRRQQLEAARRQRLASAQRNAPTVAPHLPSSSGRAARQADTASNEQQAAASSGPPTIEDLIRQNPWLADYAPGGRFANTTPATRNQSAGTTRPGTSTNSNSGTSAGNTRGGTSANNAFNPGSADPAVTTSGTVGTTPTATSATARWIPVDNRACGSAVAGFRTNDLYVRLDAAAPVLAISSETSPLTIVGGTFFQSPAGGDDAPSNQAQATDACLRFDSYLNATGVQGFALLGGGTNNPVFTSTRVNGSLFNFTGVVGTRDPARFGDDAFYVLFGRFTASTSITGLSGRLQIETGVPGTTSFRSFTIDVPFDPAIWRFDASFGLPGTTTGGTPPPTTPPPTSPPPTTPPPTTPPPGSADPCAAAAPGLSAVWLPIDNMGCTNEDEEFSLAGARTADLYLRMASTNSQGTTPPFNLQFVSVEVTGAAPLTLTGGTFIQHPAGGNTRPTQSIASQIPCLAFDTYVAIDTALTEEPAGNSPAFQPPPQLILPPGVPLFSASAIRGLWVVSGFGPSSALRSARETTRFPTDQCGWYVRIGRFTITSGSAFSGTIQAGIVLAGSGQTSVVFVPVPNCVICWGAAQ